MLWHLNQTEYHKIKDQHNLLIDHCCKHYNRLLGPFTITWHQSKQWTMSCHSWSMRICWWNAVKPMYMNKHIFHYSSITWSSLLYCLHKWNISYPCCMSAKCTYKECNLLKSYDVDFQFYTRILCAKVTATVVSYRLSKMK